MSFNDYKILKELGKGYSGVAYLVEKDGKKYVIKRQKLLKNEVKFDTKYQFWREIDFGKFVNKLSKNQQLHFMKMYDYKVVKCDYKHIPPTIQSDSKKDLEARNKTKFCLDTVLEYKGNIIEFMVKNGMPLKERYCLIIQLLYTLEIIREKGYMHQDIHQGNITYKKAKNDIIIYGKKIPCSNVYSLIDYGLVRHKKYNKTLKSKKEFKKLYDSNNDIYEVMYQIILQQYMLYGVYIDNKWKFPDFSKEKYNKIFKEYRNDTTIWNKIRSVLSDDEAWFVYFDKYNKIKPNDLNTPEKIEYLFSAYDRKKLLKIMGWTKVYIPNFLPSEDIVFMVQHITDNKAIIKHFLKKLK